MTHRLQWLDGYNTALHVGAVYRVYDAEIEPRAGPAIAARASG
ncbi:MAG: hypothetical protein QNJ67_10410 [Kiloniellales bacterium]|nr:hypothetical protein [Kiloniellales bacterium]